MAEGGKWSAENSKLGGKNNAFKPSKAAKEAYNIGSRTAGSDLNSQLWRERSCMRKEAVHVDERDAGVS